MKLFNVLLFAVFIFCVSCHVENKQYDPETFKEDMNSLSEEDAAKVRMVILSGAFRQDESIKEMTYGEMIELYDEDWDKKERRRKTEEYEAQKEVIKKPFEKLKLVTMKTGYYENVNLNNAQVIYQPIVIMKWKNISDEPFKDAMKIRVLFIQGDEEINNSEVSFVSYGDSPLEVGLNRQCYVKSDVGYTNSYAISDSKIKARIFFDGELNQEIDIDKEIIGNVIQ
jgi:hypothetical protein